VEEGLQRPTVGNNCCAFGTPKGKSRKGMYVCMYVEPQMYLYRGTESRNNKGIQVNSEALNDDLSSKFDDRINSTDKQLLDCPNNALDAILRIMFSS